MTEDASRHGVVEAALVLLERMGLSPADLAAVQPPRRPAPTFAEYVPVVSAAVSAGTRRAYGSYLNRVIEHWGTRRLDEPTPSEIRQLMAYVKTHVVARRNARGISLDPYDTVAAALWCATRATSLRTGLVSAVQLGGDTDTVAALAGGLIGAKLTAEQVRAELPWQQLVILPEPESAIVEIAAALATTRAIQST